MKLHQSTEIDSFSHSATLPGASQHNPHAYDRTARALQINYFKLGAHPPTDTYTYRHDYITFIE